MCFTTLTTYSVSDSVNSTGRVERNTLPRAAKAGTLYNSAAASSEAGAFFAPTARWPPGTAGTKTSSTMGKVSKLRATWPSSNPLCASNLRRDRANIRKLIGSACRSEAMSGRGSAMPMSTCTVATAATFFVGATALAPSSSGAASASLAAFARVMLKSSPKRRRARVARSRTSSSSSRSERRRSTATEARSGGSAAANFARAVTAAARTAAFSRMTRL
mmetsp:Transcript_17527/g.59196  ORF Transcript_17527/g.59196 Transcript_17527/m.59196 type:complete len:219 (+) Transcript_17527:868-1524(+)